ncbi:hypothetical protein [Oceanispirochaeta sp.]|uniref:hypothetical protein n=1 Tax=Oceanispirochaeta sp. TaxID=2035350 RepID=UPI0026173BF3|nr:hypothetical protein [Oceanispirochaeta sp.]MDA3958069.1 hypothetical protein [Oceanispirochaeta sp.]
MSEKQITVKEFSDELVKRLNKGKTVDCCKKELLNLAALAREKMGDEKIMVDWKD